jgi:hypothetical protein
MTSRLRRQLALDFDSAGRLRPVERMPEGLIEALAELLIEALGFASGSSSRIHRLE